jgi:hypothetical protein
MDTLGVERKELAIVRAPGRLEKRLLVNSAAARQGTRLATNARSGSPGFF